MQLSCVWFPDATVRTGGFDGPQAPNAGAWVGKCVMVPNSTAYAFHVACYLKSPSGSLVCGPCTVCFDLELALAMAEDDFACAAGVAVYAMDERGRHITEQPIVGYGVCACASLSAVVPQAVMPVFRHNA